MIYNHPSRLMPSWKQGFARSAFNSEHPILRKGLRYAGISALGPTGETLHDVSGYSQNGTLTNMEAGDWGLSMGLYGLDFSPSQSDDEVIVPDPIKIGGETEVTHVMGFRANSISNNNRLLHKVENQQLRINGTNLEWGLFFSGGFRVANISSPSTDDFHVFVGRWDSVSRLMETFLDGVAGGTNASGPNIALVDNANDLHIGNFDGLDRGFDGNIFFVLQYDRKLTNNEINLFNDNPLAPFQSKPFTVGLSSVVVAARAPSLALLGVGA